MKGDLSKIGTRQENFAKGEDRDQARPFENQERRQQFGVRDTFCDHKSPTLSSFDRQRLDDRESSCRCETRTNYKRFTGREATIEKQKLFEDMHRLENLRRRQHFDDCERFGDCQWQHASSYGRRRFSDDFDHSRRSTRHMNGYDDPINFNRDSTGNNQKFTDFEKQKFLENMRISEYLRRRQQFDDCERFGDCQWQHASSYGRRRFSDDFDHSRRSTRHMNGYDDPINFNRDSTGNNQKFTDFEKQKFLENMRISEYLRRRQQFDDCERFGDCQWQRASSYNRQRFSDHCQDSHRSAENMNKCDGAKKFDRESTFGPETLADFEDMRRLENLRRRQQYEDYDRFGDRRWQRTSSFGRPRFADDCHDSGRSEKHTERCGDSQRDSAFEARKFPDYEDMRRFRT